MDQIYQLLAIMLGAILANNFIFSQFLGCCPFLGVSKKTETALGDVHCANLSRKVVYFIKQIFMDLGKSPECTDFKCVQQALLKHLQCLCLADPFLRLCQFSGVGDTQLILQCHKRHPPY